MLITIKCSRCVVFSTAVRRSVPSIKGITFSLVSVFPDIPSICFKRLRVRIPCNNVCPCIGIISDCILLGPGHHIEANLQSVVSCATFESHILRKGEYTLIASFNTAFFFQLTVDNRIETVCMISISIRGFPVIKSVPLFDIGCNIYSSVFWQEHYTCLAPISIFEAIFLTVFFKTDSLCFTGIVEI